MGVAYVKGLQGNGKRLKAAACIKHYAVHSGPEQGRHSFNSIVSKKDMAETYLPAFEKCVREARAEGVMGGYNRINGEAACGSRYMITQLLREKWGFEGYFVSDCGAIKDFHMHHGLTDTVRESAALALRSGCDMNCGAVYLHILGAYGQGLIEEEDIDRAAYHVMRTRMRLGMFDAGTESGSPWRKAPASFIPRAPTLSGIRWRAWLRRMTASRRPCPWQEEATWCFCAWG